MTDSYTVLIVEDEAHWQDILRELLEDEGYQVTVIADYQSGRQTLQEREYDLIILDLELDQSTPTLEGNRLLKLISRQSLNMPCIVVSGQSDPQTIRDAFKRYHVLDFIAKSHFGIDTFLQAVKDALVEDQIDVGKDSQVAVAPTTLVLSLRDRFSLEEIQDLCFGLEIDFEDLQGKGKKAREIVNYCRRHGRFKELADAIMVQRPDVF